MIIGLIGSQRSGKDTVADFLVKAYNFKKIAFADQIKEEYFSKTDVTEEIYEKLKKEDKCNPIREKLWNYSKTIKQINGQDYFIKIVLSKLDCNNWVITDIRTKLELAAILEKGANVIVIKKSELESEIKDSELSIDNIKEFDTIINDQTLEKLEENLEIFFRGKWEENK